MQRSLLGCSNYRCCGFRCSYSCNYAWGPMRHPSWVACVPRRSLRKQRLTSPQQKAPISGNVSRTDTSRALFQRFGNLAGTCSKLPPAGCCVGAIFTQWFTHADPLIRPDRSHADHSVGSSVDDDGCQIKELERRRQAAPLSRSQSGAQLILSVTAIITGRSR